MVSNNPRINVSEHQIESVVRVNPLGTYPIPIHFRQVVEEIKQMLVNDIIKRSSINVLGIWCFKNCVMFLIGLYFSGINLFCVCVYCDVMYTKTWQNLTVSLQHEFTHCLL